MAILLRRFTIICLTFMVFALVMVMAVDSQSHRPAFGQLSLNAPCPQPLGIHCTANN